MAVNRPQRIGTNPTNQTDGMPLTISNLDDYFKALAKNIQTRTEEEKKSVKAVETYKRKLDDDRIKDREKRDRQHILDLAQMESDLNASNLKLTQAQKKRYAKIQADKDKTEELKRLTEYYKEVSKKEKRKREDERKAQENALETQKELKKWDSKGGTFAEGAGIVYNQMKRGLENVFSSSGLSKLGTEKLAEAMNQLTAGINSAMESYANYHAQFDTRLQGSYYSLGVLGSSFDKLISNLGVVSNSGLLSTEDLYKNLSELIDSGVVTNLEQRAFFGTIKDTVATTFDVNSKALNRIIRLQQEDSTASRLGMEGYLTRFLNEFVESTEYLTSTFDTVADSLLEASSLMSRNQSVEFEYIVQKWLGTLTGLGLSESTSSNIASAIGQLASGNISELSSSAMQNLLVMAASRSGLSYADMLTNGMDAISANDLLYGIVSYMQELGSYSSNVVKSELAKTFGVTVSDIVAAQNMTSKDLQTAYKSVMSAGQMNLELAYQLGQTGSRLGISKILSNLYKNTEYSTGMQIAKNPALYALWKITDFISSATGQEGVAIPSFSVMGNQIDLETTVDALLKGGIAGIGMLSNIGGIISGLASTATGSGNVLLGALQASTLLGNALGKAKSGLGFNTNFYSGLSGSYSRVGGSTTSATTYTGNYNSTDYSDSVVNQATDDAQKTLDNKIEDQKTEDESVTYLKDLEFSDKMEQLTEDIHSLRSDGVDVKNLSNSLFTSNIGGWYLGGA